MNTQDWSPLGWTGWISLQSKGLSVTYSYNISYVQLNKINPFPLEIPIWQAIPGHCPPPPQAGTFHAQVDADPPHALLVPFHAVFFPSHAALAVALSARMHAHLQPSHHLLRAYCRRRLC